MFLIERTGSCLATWDGRMPAAQQRALFGRFFGKGLIVIDGADETVQHIVKVCFGHDYSVDASVKWGAL